MSNMKWIFSSALAIIVLAFGYVMHGVIEPCPEAIPSDVQHDTLTFYFRDTVKVPVVKFVSRVDTVIQYASPAGEALFLSTKEYSDSVANVEARVWARCEVDSIGLKVDVRPIIIEHTREVIVTDTIKTIIKKPGLGHKLTYGMIGALIGGAAVLVTER